MKRNIPWWVLILIGLAGALVGRLINGVVGSAIGVLGDIFLLIGIANMFVALIKNIKVKKEHASKKNDPKTKEIQDTKNNSTYKIRKRDVIIVILIIVIVILGFLLIIKSNSQKEIREVVSEINTQQESDSFNFDTFGEASKNNINKYGGEVIQIGGQGSKTYKATAYLLNEQGSLEPPTDWIKVDFNRTIDIMDVRCKDGYVMYSCSVNGVDYSIDDILGCRNIFGNKQSSSVNINCIEK